jgi:hypothetical protein
MWFENYIAMNHDSLNVKISDKYVDDHLPEDADYKKIKLLPGTDGAEDSYFLAP